MSDNNWGPALQGTGEPFEGYQYGEEWQSLSISWYCRSYLLSRIPDFRKDLEYRFRPDSEVYKALEKASNDRYAALEAEFFDALVNKIVPSLSASIKAGTKQMTHKCGPKGHIVEAFIKHLEGMPEEQWVEVFLAIVDAASYEGWASALDHVRSSIINEIIGADLMRERNQPFFFLPIFGFADETEIPL